jgi:hypothetical protein
MAELSDCVYTGPFMNSCQHTICGRVGAAKLEGQTKTRTEAFRSALVQNDISVAKSTRQEPITQQLQLLSLATFFQWILAVHECSWLVRYRAATSFHSGDKSCQSERFHDHMTNNAGWYQVGCLFCLSFPLQLRHQRRRGKLFHHLTIKL